MKKIVIASTNPGAGKTSLTLGLAKAWGKKFAYLKPLGDRLQYKKKRQWDFDAAVVTALCGLKESPENMTIGFEHSKLRYMYDQEGLKEKLSEAIAAVKEKNDFMLFESGKSLTYGLSVNLDALSIARYVDGKLIVVVSGNDDVIVDDLTFLKQYLKSSGVDFVGAVINKVRDKDDFQDTHRENIRELGIPILGIIPFHQELTYLRVSYLADRLFAKVISGEQGLQNNVKHVVVGAMSADAVQQLPLFGAEAKLVITSGDRSDMILAALETKAAAVVLTNNILPPANIVSKASELGIPLLLVKGDTFDAAKQVDDLEPLTTQSDEQRADILNQLVREHVELDKIT